MMQKDEERWREYKSDEKNNREGEKERDRERRWQWQSKREKREREAWVPGPGVGWLSLSWVGMTARYRGSDRTRRRTPLPTVDRGEKIDGGRRREKEETARGVKCM